MAAVAGSVTAKMKGLNGNGEILAAKSAQVQKEEEQEQKRPGTSADYVALGSGIFMSFCLYLLGNILGHIPGLQRDPWTGMDHYPWHYHQIYRSSSRPVC